MLNKGRKRDEMVGVRFSDEEIKNLNNISDREKIRASVWIRSVVLKKMDKMKAEGEFII